MKKWIMILVFILLVQVSYKIIFVFAIESESVLINTTQQEQDSIAIKKVIETFLESFTKRDLDSMMSQVSKNYSEELKDGSIADYGQSKSFYEKLLKNTVNISISNLNVLKLNISDNKATILLEYNFKGFALDTNKDINTVRKKEYSLVKEDGIWKIVSIHSLHGPRPR